MAQTIILENEYATLGYDDTHRYVFHTFHQAIGGEHLRHVINTGADILKAKGATKWLSDDRKNAEMSLDDIIYGVQVWGPRAAAAGWKFWALIVPEANAGRASMQDLVNGYFELGVRVAIFTNLEEAQAWIISH